MLVAPLAAKDVMTQTSASNNNITKRDLLNELVTKKFGMLNTFQFSYSY